MSRRWLMTFLSAVGATALTATAFAAPGVKAHAPKAPASHATKPTTAKGPAMKTTAPKSTAPKVKPIKVKTTTKAPAGPKVPKTKSTTASGPAKAKRSTTSSTTTAATTWAPNNPVAQKLSTKANLLSKVTNSLPPGTDLNAATAGFKNFGQFVAVVNVSNNLGIPFADLKASMTGITMAGAPTGESPVSLGRAIQELKPGVNADVEATKAQKLADREIK